MIQNLIPNDPAHFKTLLVGHAVDDHVAVYADKVLGVEYRVLVLACRVDDFDGKVLVLVPDDFAEGVFDCRVVGVDKVAVYELYCEGGFAWIGAGGLANGFSLSFSVLRWVLDGGSCTDGPAADYGHLSLLLLWRHVERRGVVGARVVLVDA